MWAEPTLHKRDPMRMAPLGGDSYAESGLHADGVPIA